jgi:hypothetical protein
MKDTDRLLSVGLVTGYGGGTEIKKHVKRGPFEVTRSTYTSPDGDIYYDEWTDSGGQEIVRTKDGSEATRVYAGQVLPDVVKLTELGLTPKDVIVKLKSRITRLGDTTRLDEPCHPEPEGDWGYSYDILQKDVEGIPLTIGLERQTYKGTTVFAHSISKSPIK